MKHFVVIEDIKLRRGYLHLSIFQVKKNELLRVAVTRYQPSSTRGAQSEVMTALSNAGLIPKKYGKHGVYYSSATGFKINILDPNWLGDIAKDFCSGKLENPAISVTI